jgi:hypothetical protein
MRARWKRALMGSRPSEEALGDHLAHDSDGADDHEDDDQDEKPAYENFTS